MRLRLKRSDKEVTVSVHGWIGIPLLIALLSVPYLLSLSYSLTDAEATALIRHYLKYQAGQRYAELYRERRADAQAGRSFLEEIAGIDRLQFESVVIGRLLPDYLFSVRPSFFVKAVIRDDAGRQTTRYFNLARGGALVLGESSRFVWTFVF